jgi:peptide-methionine (S)-S-oxide reductase
MELATLAAGCFWCVEAVFQKLKGVSSVVSGYSGGTVTNPTYEQVCTGRTGHAEVCQITFYPTIITYEEILEVFFEIHDPTTLNRQGDDVGTQYRSAIFYHTEKQREIAERVKVKYDQSQKLKKPIVTEITKFTEFFPAEDYHQDFFKRNPNQSYCRLVISPKLDKFEKTFTLKLK